MKEVEKREKNGKRERKRERRNYHVPYHGRDVCDADELTLGSARELLEFVFESSLILVAAGAVARCSYRR